ncbi:hypothetical protein BP6252_12387 [Coleophoma cylindrospora]|uniref:Uncharacterized protein n=1 Tax=Coleophoma cylindrospora TaxID=1849047 RepID=A0A3D8QHW5_9HELO|nr:hypothetical protein BP6252_12387 [Coleophoma cylindrospora]
MSTPMDIEGEPDATQDVAMEGTGVTAVKEEEEQPSAVLGKEEQTSKQTYKSFKKKYRKMRAKFDETMRQSNEYYVDEQKASDTAKRLAQENDRLLDLLLDVNSSAQIPPHHRFDLTLDTPSLSAVPGLESESEVLKSIDRSTAAGEAIYKEIQEMLQEKVSEKEASKLPSGYGSRSFAGMLKATPHHSLGSPVVSAELLTSLETIEDGHPAPISYLTLDQADEYLYEIDTTLFKTAIPPPKSDREPYLDLAMRNPHSVYNWLRRHEPKIFLQDGEGSEKSLGKPGALRGAGKRASIPAPSKPDALEFVEEDGIGYDGTLAGASSAKSAYGKRKREDDEGYMPKKRNSIDDPKPKKPRQSRKRKSEMGADGAPPASSGRKSKKDKEVIPASSPPPPSIADSTLMSES